MTVKQTAEALEAALKTVDGIRVYRDPGAKVDPPAAVLGPPQLFWETGLDDPTSARFLIYVIEKADKRALERLWERIPSVAEAIDGEVDAVVRSANPGSYSSGGSDLPAYIVEVEASI